MLGHIPTHLSTCQGLRDCESPSCQASCDGWVSLASRGSKALDENERDKRREKGVKVNIENWKGRFSDTQNLYWNPSWRRTQVKTRHWSVSSEILKMCVGLWVWGGCRGIQSCGWFVFLTLVHWKRQPWSAYLGLSQMWALSRAQAGKLSHQAAPSHLTQS